MFGKTVVKPNIQIWHCVGSTITKFRLRFNQYKSNIMLYGEGRGNFKQEKLIEHFYSENHNGTHKDINVKTIDFLCP